MTGFLTMCSAGSSLPEAICLITPCDSHLVPSQKRPEQITALAFIKTDTTLRVCYKRCLLNDGVHQGDDAEEDTK